MGRQALPRRALVAAAALAASLFLVSTVAGANGPVVTVTQRLPGLNDVAAGGFEPPDVSVGAGSQHPSLAEHAVRYIALYKDTAEIARVYLHPVYSAPVVTFTIALDESGSLRAVAEPTHSAAWEASKEITVTP